MEQVPLVHILILSSILFFLGVYGFFARRNMLMMLMSTELILNSVNINFIAFNKYLYPHQLEGMFFSMFIITVAAGEVSLAIAIIINLYRRFKTVDVEDTTTMKY
ncbi:NADH-quinone oxidoreductase subunit NuoK [Parabacteroides sp. FAFU027]|jgi:NADH:ubiquinone oxidoreductase subunit 11 or 4L (chain K)|uniref:NADH-quinone oxidoreductase subunit NuoK n=1 Tax=Parabacteroides sp. FAFU027 TaxID=2922715 RepID=UPI001FAE81F7|nr:NADH-quinone oxidoreductase subunit NuoK [Parabacteroides sp. FAFU027]